MSLTLFACGKKEVTVDTDALLAELSGNAMFFDANLAQISEKALKNEVGIDPENYVSATYFVGSGFTGEEYGVFECTDEKTAEIVEECLEARVDRQRESLESYAPEAVFRLDNAVIEQSGKYVAIIVAEDFNAAGKLLNSYLG